MIKLRHLATFQEMIRIDCGVEYEYNGIAYVNEMSQGIKTRMRLDYRGGFNSKVADMP